MRSGGNNFNYFTENQLTATAGLLVNFGHTLSVGLLVRPWPTSWKVFLLVHQ